MPHDLRTTAGCQATLNDVLEEPPESFGRKDPALMNLLCTVNLPGSETLDIPASLETSFFGRREPVRTAPS